MVKHEETDASKLASIMLALQFATAMVNALYRSEVTPVLCLIGFYAVQERKMNATRTVSRTAVEWCLDSLSSSFLDRIATFFSATRFFFKNCCAAVLDLLGVIDLPRYCLALDLWGVPQRLHRA